MYLIKLNRNISMVYVGGPGHREGGLIIPLFEILLCSNITVWLQCTKKAIFPFSMHKFFENLLNYNVFNSNFCGYLKLLPCLKSNNPEITRIGSFYKNLNFFSTDIDLQNGRLAKNTSTDAMDFNNWQSSQCQPCGQ